MQKYIPKNFFQLNKLLYPQPASYKPASYKTS